MNRLFLVGMGPGNPENMTAVAIRAIEEAELLCGYSVYLDLIRDRWPEKETYTSPMTEELARCRYAVEQAGFLHRFRCLPDTCDLPFLFLLPL